MYKHINDFPHGTWIICRKNKIILKKTHIFSESTIERIELRSGKEFPRDFREMTQQECFEHGKEIGAMFEKRRLIKEQERLDKVYVDKSHLFTQSINRLNKVNRFNLQYPTTSGRLKGGDISMVPRPSLIMFEEFGCFKPYDKRLLLI